MYAIRSYYAQQVRREVKKGNREYSQEKYNEAELRYRKALEKEPENSVAAFNLGNSLYKQQQYEPAITKFEKLIQTDADNVTLSKYYYNLA